MLVRRERHPAAARVVNFMVTVQLRILVSVVASHHGPFLPWEERDDDTESITIATL